MGSRIACLLLLLAAALAAAQPATIDLRVDEKPLFTLIERIARQCDVGLSVSHGLQDRLAEVVTINARNAAWDDALLLLRQQHRLAVRLDGDRLVVEDADEEVRKRVVAVRYDIRHLLTAKYALPGPSLRTPSAGGGGACILPPIEPAPAPEAVSLVELIKQRVAPHGWDEARGTLVEDADGILTVYQLPEVQARVAALLRELEGQLLRQVQVRLWRLPAAAAAAATGELLDPAAFATLAKGLAAPDLAFITANEQQNHGYAGTQRHVVLDADVVQSRYQGVVGELMDGLSLDVQPQSTRLGILVTCRFAAAATAATLASTPVRDGQGRTMLAVDQPERSLDSVRCTLLIPDGGAAILRFGDRAYALQVELYQPPAR